MRDVFEYAKYFMKSDVIENHNTYDGNMKLQKLLFFTKLVAMAIGEPKMYNEELLAYDNGCVVEKVRLRYKNDYHNFKQDSYRFNPDFDKNEYHVLSLVNNIFGKLSAKELSDINHQFDFWKKANSFSSITGTFREKANAVIDENDIEDEIDKVKSIIEAYNSSVSEDQSCEIINGVVFYYKKDEIKLDNGILSQLEDFSNKCEDKVYSLYYDNSELVIY